MVSSSLFRTARDNASFNAIHSQLLVVAFQAKCAKRYEGDFPTHGVRHSNIDQNLAVRGRGTQPGRQIDDIADGRVLDTALVPDLAHRRRTCRKTYPKTNRMAARTPANDGTLNSILHVDCHLHGTKCWF